MSYFKDNKLVSRARRGLLNVETESSFLVQAAQTYQETDILEELKKPMSEIVDLVKNE
jgi:hypothetical protein